MIGEIWEYYMPLILICIMGIEWIILIILCLIDTPLLRWITRIIICISWIGCTVFGVGSAILAMKEVI